MTSSGAGDEAAARGEALGEGPHAEVDLVLEAEQLGGPRAAPAEDSHAVRLIHHQPRPEAPAKLDDRRQVADVALHREDAVDHHQRPAPVGDRPLQHRLQLVHPVVAEGPKAGAGELAAIENRGVVARIADHRVTRLEDGADRAQVRLVAGREHDHVFGPHPVGELPLQLHVHGRGAVEQARSGDTGAVLLQGVAGRLLDPLVRGQSQVVVGAQHDRLASLHLHHGPRLGLEDPEIGEEVALFGGFELLDPIMGPGLLEDIRHNTGRAVAPPRIKGGVGHAPGVSHV